MATLLRMGNIQKTLAYLRKNGLTQTYYAVRERRAAANEAPYSYIPPSDTTLEKQRQKSAAMGIKFSIIVPVCDPQPVHFRAMVESVLAQTYPRFELILADAGKNEAISSLITTFRDSDERIKALSLPENKGIAANTSAALEQAGGDYVGLLDHDDLLTPDALYEMAACIDDAAARGISAALLYSDEDKMDEDGAFFDHHIKPGLDIDLLMSNNYICHFSVLRRDIISALGLRGAYDGAQDYDLVLRAMNKIESSPGSTVIHIAKVLYHWRSHAGSTAASPRSKKWAYEAGRRAVADFIRERGYQGTVSHSRHLGFYRVAYEPDVFSQRPMVGVIGGKLLDKGNKITGGIYQAPDATALYMGLHKHYSGYMHRAALAQGAWAVDIRCMRVAPPLQAVFAEVVGHPYLPNPHNGCFDWRRALPPDSDYKKLSLQFCERVRDAAYTIVWNPQLTEILK